MRTSVFTTVAVAGLLAAIGQAHAADTLASQQIQQIDVDGAYTETTVSSLPTDPDQPNLLRQGVVWQSDDVDSICESIVVADTTDETWVGWNLNYERMAAHQTTGAGTPVFEYFPVNPQDFVAVASAEDVSLCAVLWKDTSGGLYVYGFTTAGGATPVWTYTVDAAYPNAGIRNVDVAADGSIVVVGSYNGASPWTAQIVVLDGGTGAELNTTLITDTTITGVDLSLDGSRAVLTTQDTARVIETAGLTQLFSFSVSGQGGFHRISGNGMVAAAGGFNCRAYRDTGSGWTSAFYQYEGSQWYGGGIAVSADGTTMCAGSRNYTNEVLTLRSIDLTTGTEIARVIPASTGSNQDVVDGAQISQDGTVIAFGTWGRTPDPHPEVMIFDRDMNLIGEVNTTGSVFSIDMTRDGRYVAIGTKSVHANQMGRGGSAIIYEVDSGCPEDLSGDGFVGQEDLGILLASYELDDGGDIDGDGDTDQSDLGMLLALYGQPCP
ncbi:MAG: hypothetical protein KAS72_04620 [Phycisphaerales bacterium]|nr:hypothetical protein [Phycisphaerales bacterium]